MRRPGRAVAVYRGPATHPRRHPGPHESHLEALRLRCGQAADLARVPAAHRAGRDRGHRMGGTPTGELRVTGRLLFIVDEDVPQSAADLLADVGHDVRYVRNE